MNTGNNIAGAITETSEQCYFCNKYENSLYLNYDEDLKIWHCQDCEDEYNEFKINSNE